MNATLLARAVASHAEARCGQLKSRFARNWIAAPIQAKALNTAKSYPLKPQQLSIRQPVFAVDFAPRTIIIALSRSGKGRVHDRLRYVAAGCGGRNDAGPRQVAEGGSFRGGWGRRRRNGRTAQVHVRATARSNGGTPAAVAIPGTWSKPRNPSACGAQA